MRKPRRDRPMTWKQLVQVLVIVEATLSALEEQRPPQAALLEEIERLRRDVVAPAVERVAG